MLHILRQSLADFLRPKILSLVCVPVICNILLVGSILYFCGASFYQYVLDLSPEWIANLSVNAALWARVLSFLYVLSIYLFLGLCVGILTLLTSLFFALFYTPLLVKFVHKKDFSHIHLQPFGNLVSDMLVFFKDGGIFIALLIVCIPLYFIPLCGTLIPLILGFFFFKRRNFYDVGSCTMNKEQFESLQKFSAQNYLCALMAYLPSSIPFVSFFLMPLQILIIIRYALSYLEKPNNSPY